MFYCFHNDRDAAPAKVNYSFMECGDLVSYRPPGSKKKELATVKSFSRDEQGRPCFIVIELLDGSWIETTADHISY